MKKIKYVPIIKMADAEMRAIDNLSDLAKDKITPLFELTRSRSTKKLKEGDIFRRLIKLQEVFGNRRFFLDLTDDPNLSNTQIRKLHNNTNGYENWTEFMISLKNDFPLILPVIQISDEGVDTAEEHFSRIKQQLAVLNEHFDYFAYRFRLDYEFVGEDLTAILSEISSNKLICFIDTEFIHQNKAAIYREKAIRVINQLNEFSPALIILSSTSFPRNPIEFGNEEYGKMRIEEHFLFESIYNEGKGQKIVYSDYATLNPTRSDQAGGRGWIPRIDVTTIDEIFYHRSRKTKVETTYLNAYKRVAKLIVAEGRYQGLKRKVSDCWGIKQIESAASGSPQGLSPSFWISVRMNLHITLRVS